MTTTELHKDEVSAQDRAGHRKMKRNTAFQRVKKLDGGQSTQK